jgi:hypothetical protein
MPNLRFKEYDPDGTTQAKPITTEEWDRHERRIRALHAAKYKRSEALEKLRADCGCGQNCSFSPSYVKHLNVHSAFCLNATTTALALDFDYLSYTNIIV